MMVDEHDSGNGTNTESSDQPRVTNGNLSTQAAEEESTQRDKTQGVTKASTGKQETACVPLATSHADEIAETADVDVREKQYDDAKCVKQSTPAETEQEALDRQKLERRRRRRPSVDVDQCSEGEGKDETEGLKRSAARVIMQGETGALARWLRDGGSASEADNHGWTPLHWACSRGSVSMTSVLLHGLRAAKIESTVDEADGDHVRDCDPLNAKEHVNGWTPLHLAAVGEFLDVVYLLMEAGCDPSVKDNLGDKAINCVERATARQGKRCQRLRNALLDLSDSDSSDDVERSVNQRSKEDRRGQGVDSSRRASN